MRRWLLGFILLAGCSADPGAIGSLQRPLSSLCTVNVTGKGIKEIETDYLPHVITCENGAADTEALKAQAVAARTYLYYSIKTDGGSVCDSQSCQVYTCSAKPSSKHYDAVKATSGQVLMWDGVVICSFFVAGAIPTTSSCVPKSSDSDPTNTEKYVTYNDGKTGSAVTQSPLGWVNPANKYNRGCKSQNGANCLSKRGWDYVSILKFYYGADVKLTQTTGSCVHPPVDQGVPDVAPPPDVMPPDLPPPDLGADDLEPPEDATAPNTDQYAFTDGWMPRYDASPERPALQGGCSVSPRAPAPWTFWLWLMGGLAWLRARRRRR